MSESRDLDRARESEIVERAQRLFAESVRSLDGSTRARLAEGRAKAVAAAGSGGFPWLAPSRLVPLGAAAAAALAVAVIWQGPQSTPGLLPPAVLDSQPAVLNDLDILLEAESFDLFEELEFYAWLLEQPELMEADESADGSG